ncbi:hypothetical protein D3C71_1641160 [compost metagenome]
MRHVPHGHHAATFLLRPPVHHGPATRRPTHALRPAVDEQQNEHHGHAGRRPGRETENEHHPSRHQKTEWQEEARVGTVGHQAHEKLRQTVGNRDGGHRQTQLATGVAFIDQVRHGQGEVLAQQVVTGIANENAGENLPAKASVGAVYFFFRQWSLMCGRTKESKHSRAPDFLF